MAETASLADALARVQSQLHPVTKDKKANAGSYAYSYADLASVQALVYPLLSAEGLSWIALPTWDADGRFVLAYSLMHGPSGERESGSYPLPDPTRGTPQQAGSALTYARRYCLSAVVGVATEDDDGKAASDGSAPKATRRPVSPAAKHDRELRGKGSSEPDERGPTPTEDDPWASTPARKPPNPDLIPEITAAVAGCEDLKTLRTIRADVVAKAKTGELPESDAGDLLTLIDEAGGELRAKYEAEQAAAATTKATA